MRFQPVKCNMMQLTRKWIKKIHASYTLEGTARLQKCRQICIFSMPLVFTGIYGKYGIYGKFNGQLSNISVLNNTP